MPGRNPGPLRITFVHSGDPWIRGSERILLDLLSNLDRARVSPMLICDQQIMADAAMAISVPTVVAEMRTYLADGTMAINPLRLLRQAGFARLTTIEHANGRPAIIHSNGAAPCQWMAPYARSAGIPLVAHLHTKYLKRSRYALMTHLASRIIGVSDDALRGYEADGMPSERLGIIENGISPDRINGPRPPGGAPLRDMLGIASTQPVILSVGSLIRRKGHDRLIEALAASGRTDAHLVIIGEGSERAALEALAARHGIADRVHLAGDVDAAPFYRDATVFALASRSEAFGLALAEAGIAGKSSIASNTGGMSRVIDDERTGLLTSNDTDEQAIKEIAEAIRLLVGNDEVREKLGRDACERVTTLFTSARTAQRFHHLYDEMDAMRADSGWAGIPKGVYLPAWPRGSKSSRQEGMR